MTRRNGVFSQWHGHLARECQGHLAPGSSSFSTGGMPVGLMGGTPMLLYSRLERLDA
jgi:hypothetical protein